MAKLNIKKGDTVLVLAGKDKGKTGRLTAVYPQTNTVVVENVNIHTKHKKARNAQEKSGIEKIEAPFDASNVQVICPKCGKATRVAHKIENGKKERICKKCGASLDAGAASKETKKTTKKSKEAETTTEVKAEEKAEAKTTAKKSTKTATAKKAEVEKKDE